MDCHVSDVDISRALARSLWFVLGVRDQVYDRPTGHIYVLRSDVSCRRLVNSCISPVRSRRVDMTHNRVLTKTTCAKFAANRMAICDDVLKTVHPSARQELMR